MYDPIELKHFVQCSYCYYLSVFVFFASTIDAYHHLKMILFTRSYLYVSVHINDAFHLIICNIVWHHTWNLCSLRMGCGIFMMKQHHNKQTDKKKVEKKCNVDVNIIWLKIKINIIILTLCYVFSCERMVSMHSFSLKKKLWFGVVFFIYDRMFMQTRNNDDNDDDEQK